MFRWWLPFLWTPPPPPEHRSGIPSPLKSERNGRTSAAVEARGSAAAGPLLLLIKARTSARAPPPPVGAGTKHGDVLAPGILSLRTT